MNNTIIFPLNGVGIKDIENVGGKNASLGEMLQNLSPLGVDIPEGLVITVDAYRKFLHFNGLERRVMDVINSVDFNSIESLRRGGQQARLLLQNGRFPKDMSEHIIDAYVDLSQKYNQYYTDVAVRSSATAEDLPDASFAGQQETFLNVHGPANLMDSVRNCFASLFTDRAISYRQTFGYDHFNVGLSICVQKMVRSDMGSSGVAFSLDPESGFKEVVVINGSYGLGELVVQGAVSPDEFIVFKQALRKGFASIIEKKLGVKDKMMIYGDRTDERVKIISTEKGIQNRFCLSDEQVIKLSEWVMLIEEYYTKSKGHWTPMDIEWAIDGLSNRLFIVQARPETIHSRKNINNITEYRIANKHKDAKIILEGIAVGDKIASGRVNIFYSLDKRVIEGKEFNTGDILVTDMTDPDWEPIMKEASAIVTNRGGRTCHAAIIARELGVPAIVGCGNATDILQEGQDITVSCAEGEKGFVYNGKIDFIKKDYNLSDLPAVKIPVLLNVASPSRCFQFSHLPAKGVGLAREEFIMSNYIQIHPLALLHHKKLNDEVLTKEIEKRIAGYVDEEDYFVKKLSFGIAKIASSFYPNKVIVRFSDFKSNEYFNLLGGSYFEPHEENPMIGWRGASRYYSDSYKPAFGLECKAVKNVREVLGLDNVTVMIPFCRTVEELLKVQDVMKEFGLKRKENNLEVYLMAEIPSNILLADEFAKYIDGFSIGSNDLTQLALGLDRDSALVAHLYDERNDAVKKLISDLIKTAKKNNVKVGICGQGPSDFPDFAQFLVQEGIDSISVTPDSILKTIKAISQIENEQMIRV
ncbi:MAG: phosphoenolpyruvate synthase [Chitinophagaceae bacterium]|nr:MAG: phosphoenolpyruvate synthase [Chitinophagaceae bacterium]